MKKDRDDYKSRFENEQKIKSRIQRDLWKIESDLDQEQFKRDQVELKMEQLKQQVIGKALSQQILKFTYYNM